MKRTTSKTSSSSHSEPEVTIKSLPSYSTVQNQSQEPIGTNTQFPTGLYSTSFNSRMSMKEDKNKNTALVLNNPQCTNRDTMAEVSNLSRENSLQSLSELAEDIEPIRIVALLRFSERDSYGFYLKKSDGYGFISEVEEASIATTAGLTSQDIIVGVNGILLTPFCKHEDLIGLIRQNASYVDFLLAPAKTFQFYLSSGIEFRYHHVKNNPSSRRQNNNSRPLTNRFRIGGKHAVHYSSCDQISFRFNVSEVQLFTSEDGEECPICTTDTQQFGGFAWTIFVELVKESELKFTIVGSAQFNTNSTPRTKRDSFLRRNGSLSNKSKNPVLVCPVIRLGLLGQRGERLLVIARFNEEKDDVMSTSGGSIKYSQSVPLDSMRKSKKTIDSDFEELIYQMQIRVELFKL